MIKVKLRPSECRRFFNRVGSPTRDFCSKCDSHIPGFLNGKLHIILKIKNLEIGQQSSFLICVGQIVA